MTDVIEYGKCEVCGKEAALKRTYFRYGFKCQCHSPNHFEFVRHCVDCVPQKPTETKVVFSSEQAENIEPVKRGEWVEDICCDEVIICNACGNEAYFDLDEGTYIEFDYCPFCGAKMVGDD